MPSCLLCRLILVSGWALWNMWPRIVRSNKGLRGAWLLHVPPPQLTKARKKEWICSRNLPWRGTDPPAGWLPYFSSLGRSSRKKAKVQCFAQAATDCTCILPADVKSGFNSSEDLSNQRGMHKIKCFLLFVFPWNLLPLPSVLQVFIKKLAGWVKRLAGK